MPRSFTPTTWCLRRSSRRGSGRGRAARGLRPRPLRLGSVHGCYWGYSLDGPGCTAAGGGLCCRWTGRVCLRGRRCRTPNGRAVRPLRRGRGADAHPGPGTRCRPNPQPVGGPGSPRRPTGRAPGRRIRRARRQRRRRLIDVGHCHTRRPVLGHRSLRRGTGYAPVRPPKPASGVHPGRHTAGAQPRLRRRGGSAGGPRTRDRIGQPHPGRRRRTRPRRPRKRRSRSRVGQLPGAGAVGTGAALLSPAVGLWRPGRGGVKVGICPLFRRRAWPGLARHRPRDCP